tara:strand:- start:15664 stop:15801 length:138 start_codon:yes stop_codon:yes gene_type:complete
MMVILTLAEWIGSLFLISISIVLIAFGFMLLIVAFDIMREKLKGE